MSKVLITGGSGHLGSLLTKLLQDKEYDVWVLDTKFPDHHTNPNESNLDHLYAYLPFDINQPFPADFAEEYDAVVHLAAKVDTEESTKMPIQYYITNINGTMNCLSKLKTKNFIFASTDSAEQCEDPYSVSKRAAEDCVIEYCMMHNPKDFSIIRISKETDDEAVISTLAQAIESPTNSIIKI